MRYSLLSRFQGGILGSLIGDRTSQPLRDLVWNQIAGEITERLIQSGQLTNGDWEQISQKFRIERTASSSETALLTLPLILFFHESPRLLKEKLQEAAQVWLSPSASRTALFVWGVAISLALRERLQGTHFVSQLLDSEIESPLVQQLEQIQQLIDHGIGFSQIRQSRYSPLLKAFYYFGFTPEDFRLSVARAAQSDDAPLTMALTGALSGVYNGMSGIPISWRLSTPNGTDSLQQSQRLFNTWSGAYLEHQIPTTAAIASVLVMQKRASLKILSQEE